MNNLSAKFRTVMLEIAAIFLEREEQLLAVARALLAGEHVLLLGVPGTAKSATIVEFCRRITGAHYFQRLLTKFSNESEVFGPLDIQGLKAGKYERLVDGFLPWAHVGFIDEVFKANSAILNSLLTIMAERTYSIGPVVMSTPLVSLIGASNETPQETELAAMYDRFMIRKLSRPVSDHSFTKMIDPKRKAAAKVAAANGASLSLQEWQQARAEVETVDIPDAILDEMLVLKAAMKKEGFVASDRRWTASTKLLQACAYLDGRTSVESDDLMVFADVLWDDMQQAAIVADKVGGIINPALSKLLEHIDAIDALLADMVNGATDNDRIEAKQKINGHKSSIQKLTGRIGKKGEDALARIQVKEKAAIKKILER